MTKLNKDEFVKTEAGEIISCQENLEPTKQLLDKTGCGFCLAKWTQVTIHLGSGITHSCHHVGAHKIPLEELANNPSALHNTLEKKERRKEMLQGQRPSECDYCWRIEDNTNEYSDRIHKSLSEWSIVDHDLIANSTGNENVYPRYVEVSFGNVCNFKCAYCGPPFSSKWAEEVRLNGPYKLHMTHYNGIKEHEVPIPEREHNPYIEAFWKWFPDAVQHMHTFRITGGEPLLSKHTFKVLEHLLENPQPNLEFSINTNSCVPEKNWNRFIDLLQKLEANRSVKKIQIFTSAESYGEQAEYSRDGMVWKDFIKNVGNLLHKTSTIELCFMSAFNILSLPTFEKYLDYVWQLKKLYVNRVRCDFAYVRHPYFLDIKIATKDLIEKYLKPSLDFVNSKKEFSNFEILRLKRIYKDCESRFDLIETDKNIRLNRYQFTQFVDMYDKRREKNFLAVFPEYEEFLKQCRG